MRTTNCAVLPGLMMLMYFTTVSSAKKITMKINLGGNAVDGFSGEEEILQLGEEAVKTRYHGEIKGAGEDLKVFETQRFARYEDLVIKVPVPDGIYSVTLMFAETWKGAFQPGKRVFDVYLGSRPGGVVRVSENFDLFRSGGPAGPVRRRYQGIATFEGLTVALRPIKQNAQIAGIVINGFSYSEPLLDELPTVAGDLTEVEDFSALDNVGPRPPTDPSVIYDPSLNPKFKDKRETPMGGPRSDQSLAFSQGRPSVHAQENLFPSHGGTAGPDAKMPSSFTGSSGNKPFLPVTTHPGYGSNPSGMSSVSQFPTSPMVPKRLSFRTGTVRVQADNLRSRQYLLNGTDRLQSHEASGLRRPASTHSGSPRYGRRLASIPSEFEETDIPATEQVTASSASEHDTFSSLPTDQLLASSDDPLNEQQRYPSVPKQSRFSAIAKKLKQVGNQEANVVRTAAYSESLDEPVTSDSAQYDLDIAKSTIDSQHQSSGENARIHYQAQAESMRSSSQDEEHRRRGALELKKHSPSETKLGVPTPMPQLTKGPLTESSGQEQLQQAFSEISGTPRAGGQIPQSQTEEKPSGFHSSPLPTRQQSQAQYNAKQENTEQENGNAPWTKMGHANWQANTLTQPSDNADVRTVPSNSAFEPQSSITNQRVLEAGASSNGEGMGQIGISASPVQSKSSESLKMAGIVAGHGGGYLAPPSNTGAQPHDQMGSDTSRLKVDLSTISSEPNWQNVKAFLDAGGGVPMTSKVATEETRGRGTDQVISSRSMRSMPSAAFSGHPEVHRFQGRDVKDSAPLSPEWPTPGVHNGNGRLDGLCVDNTTHCSCGMLEQTADSPEECLFVIDEYANPMICAVKFCSGKLVCACAPGASVLCQRSVVKNILVRTTMSKAEGRKDPNVVACKRESLEHGITVLTPVI